MTVFEKNIAVIRSAYPDIAERLENSPCSTAYSGIRNAKTGEAIPVFNSGQALHSLYNPVKEAERLFTGSCGFALFCGIGAGVHCDGQVLVYQDMVGMNEGFKPKFLRKYLDLYSEITSAVGQFVKDVKEQNFPNENESY